MNPYSMILRWSNEDELFLVTIPEFSDTILLRRRYANEDGCRHRVVMPCTHSKTREEAICRGEELIEMYLEAWQAENEPIPEPYTLANCLIIIFGFNIKICKVIYNLSQIPTSSLRYRGAIITSIRSLSLNLRMGKCHLFS